MHINEAAPEAIHAFPNGRTYKVVDTRKPYEQGEYPSGGFVISTLLPHSKEWSFVDYAPDQQAVDVFLRVAARLPLRAN